MLGTLAVLGLGCCKPKIEVREVKIPVAIPCPKTPKPVRPVLPIENLGPDSTEEQIRRATVSTIRALMDYARELEHRLEPYTRETKL